MSTSKRKYDSRTARAALEREFWAVVDENLDTYTAYLEGALDYVPTKVLKQWIDYERTEHGLEH
jgi:hypothetical protein